MITEANEKDFRETVLNSDRPVLVDFWAPWCGPCKMIAPVLEEIDDETGERLTIAKVNVDESRDLAGQLGLRAVPTLMLFQNGKKLGERSGALSKGELQSWIDQTLDESA